MDILTPVYPWWHSGSATLTIAVEVAAALKVKYLRPGSSSNSCWIWPGDEYIWRPAWLKCSFHDIFEQEFELQLLWQLKCGWYSPQRSSQVFLTPCAAVALSPMAAAATLCLMWTLSCALLSRRLPSKESAIFELENYSQMIDVWEKGRLASGAVQCQTRWGPF